MFSVEPQASGIDHGKLFYTGIEISHPASSEEVHFYL